MLCFIFVGVAGGDSFVSCCVARQPADRPYQDSCCSRGYGGATDDKSNSKLKTKSVRFALKCPFIKWQRLLLLLVLRMVLLLLQHRRQQPQRSWRWLGYTTLSHSTDIWNHHGLYFDRVYCLNTGVVGFGLWIWIFVFCFCWVLIYQGLEKEDDPNTIKNKLF